MRVLVCGGRGFADRTLLCGVLDGLRKTHGELRIIEGAAFGADSLAAEWAIENDQELQEFPADWKKHGRAAGPLRNQRMLDEGKPEMAVAFKGGRGTNDMVERIKKAGVFLVDVRGS